MDTNDLIAYLLKDIPAEANVLLAVKPDGSYVMMVDSGGPWKLVDLTKEQGDALALVYPKDVKTLDCVQVSVMIAELRKRLLDSVLADLETAQCITFL